MQYLLARTARVWLAGGCDFCLYILGCRPYIDANSPDFGPSNRAATAVCCRGSQDRFRAFVDTSVADGHAGIQVGSSRLGLAPAVLQEKACRNKRMTLTASNLSIRFDVWKRIVQRMSCDAILLLDPEPVQQTGIEVVR
nr:hypothetical protein [uncultured Albidiferax sp.]